MSERIVKLIVAGAVLSIALALHAFGRNGLADTIAIAASAYILGKAG